MTNPKIAEGSISGATGSSFVTDDDSSEGRGVDRAVLFVAFPEQKQLELAAAFERLGWRTVICDGPSAVSCPLVTGGYPCQARTATDVAVVMIDPDHRLSDGQLPIAFCAGCRASPGVIVVQRDMDGVEIEGRIAIVGGTSKAEVVVAAATTLIENEPTSIDVGGVT
jgi:hypothetical protein